MDKKVVIWCNLNIEQDEIEKIFGKRCASIRGSTPLEEKERLEKEWREGNINILVTKPKIFGFGLNWQHCSDIIFYGLSDSFESYYQAIRRCWRFGQTKEVNVYIITSKQESGIVSNIEKKEKFYKDMMEEVVKITADIVKQNLQGDLKVIETYNPKIRMVLPKWI